MHTMILCFYERQEAAFFIAPQSSGSSFGRPGGQWAVGLEAPGVVTPGLEGKHTIGYSRLHIAGGYAEGWFRSLHGTFGLGWP